MNLPQTPAKAPDVAPDDPPTTTEGISPHRLAYLLERSTVYRSMSIDAPFVDPRAQELARAVPELVREIRRLEDLFHGRCE